MKKWEYLIVTLNQYGQVVRPTDDGVWDATKEFSMLGGKGWELVSVDANRCYFKRPKRSKA